ncbi:hypothetical protein BKA66DRAFT_606553 [Pyrenochaeta sp. MPI-SDFR-AT-0127]|nr:hypothetical protein BKA66DRAFT_606553 [Pyrenochaeta sp. MPI-SDFR-AT-0127]
MITQAAKVCIATTTILGVIAIAIVVLRFYCRLRVQKISLGADDWCILVALLLSTGIAVLTNYVAATTGVGEKSFAPTLDQVIFALQANLGLENAQVLCMGLIKISLLLYYKRIFVLESFQIITNILIGVVIAFEMSIIIVVLLSKGTPISKQWDPMEPFTLNISAILIAFCAGNTALDVITLILPLSVVRNLHVSASKKLLLSVIFTLGSFCIVASIVRLYYAVEFTKVPATGGSFFQAPFIYNILWALIEPPVFIVAGSLLTLGPIFRGKYGPASLYRSLRSRLLSFSARSTSKSSGVSQTKDSQESASYGKLSADSNHKLWHLSVENPTTEEDERRLTWELRELDDVRTERSRRTEQSVV